jgi:mutator protein MutT
VGGIVFQGDEVLLVKRGREPGLGKWSIPGGAVEVGETVERAIQREIEEETGLIIEVVDLIEIFERIIPDPQGRIQYHYVLLDYWCAIKGGQLKAQSDADEAGFFPVDSLKTINLPQETEQVILKAYEKYKKLGHRPLSTN